MSTVGTSSTADEHRKRATVSSVSDSGSASDIGR